MEKTYESEFNNIISNVMNKCSDISKKIIKNDCGEIYVLYIKQLTDAVMLSDYVIKPMMEQAKDNIKLSADEMATHIILCDACIIKIDEVKVIDSLLNGMTIMLFSWDVNFLVIDAKKVATKSISDPELTYTLRGPRDCFTENLDVNLSLIRYRIKDPQLKIQILQVGTRTKASVAVVYINDVASDKIVQDILQRIKSIKIDGIIESGKLQRFLLNSDASLFPQTGLVERSDMACGGLLEGKVIIVVEGSELALMAPKTFTEFFWSSEDSYDNKNLATFMRILRMVGLFMSFTLGSLYIAITSFHTDMLPADYILTLAKLRASVPFNAFTTVLLLEVVVEILREALLRVPKQIGSAIGIVGAIIIGQAAITSGVFDPLSLILISLSFLASFTMPDYTIMSPFRLLKFFLMVITAIFGVFGFTFGLCIILTKMISMNSFGVAYLTPFAPYDGQDLFGNIFYGKKTTKHRPNYNIPKDRIRQ